MGIIILMKLLRWKFMRLNPRKFPQKISIMVILFIAFGISGCSEVVNMKEISQIEFSSDSGSILPELQWHEEYIIRRDSVTFVRYGKIESSKVNSGSWEIESDQLMIDELFDRLAKVNTRSIKYIEPTDSPDGGGSQSYTITYANGSAFCLSFDQGAEYSNAGLITEPVETFIEGLTLPLDASSKILME